ncbi:hypothetical protein TNIN_398991 [Trichonephila inaurata madagascariensis]|uniref:Uncharacterized protein n=1 Tax=Trichonephila inaurata madagascariensis TaxID=2747483 RepID=A0A8X7CR01_9ARAC|nr:hypothetical protein TNIN_398991 [Trichonephila inaurata madagascariensis]
MDLGSMWFQQDGARHTPRYNDLLKNKFDERDLKKWTIDWPPFVGLTPQIFFLRLQSLVYANKPTTLKTRPKLNPNAAVLAEILAESWGKGSQRIDRCKRARGGK